MALTPEGAAREQAAREQAAGSGNEGPGSDGTAVAVGDFLILDCLRESHGAAIAVPERELDPMQGRLAEAGAGYLSLETAAAVAALPVLLESRRIERDHVVIVFDTGAGFKSEPPRDLPAPTLVPNDPDRWEGILSKLGTARLI